MTAETPPPRRTSGIRWWAPWAARRRNGPDEPENASARDILLAGVREYQTRTARLVRPIMAELAMQQKPDHLFITCVDSRVVPNIITASGPGDLFIVRNVANLVPRHGTRTPDDSVAATVEYALNVLEIKTITVCGHSHCGGMAALLAGGDEVEHLPALSRWLKHGNRSLAAFLAEPAPEEDEQRKSFQPDSAPLARLCRTNVVQQLENLMTHPDVHRRVEEGALELVGMYYELETARVYVLDGETGTFTSVPQEPFAQAVGD